MVDLRQLGPDDWAIYRETRLAGLRERPGSFFRSLAEEEKEPDSFWRDRLATPRAATFGLFDGDALIGITSVYPRPGDTSGVVAELGGSYVRPGWRGQGLGRLIYDTRLAWARANSFASVITGHRASNLASARAMQRAGFVEISRQPHHWPDGLLEDDVEYELRLDPA